jgi:hypothetical protein
MEFMYFVSYLAPTGTAGYVAGAVSPDEAGDIHRDKILRDVTTQIERAHGPVALTFFSIEPRVIRTSPAAVVA